MDGASGERVDDREGHAELAEGLLGHTGVRLLFEFETCLPRNTRRRNEKLISPGGRIADPCSQGSNRFVLRNS
jgi:hypothetical protein